MKTLNYMFRVYLLLLIFTSCGQEKATPLFDGETLSGWEGSGSAFRVEDGAIIGGSLEKGLDKTFYLCTNEKYSDFELTLSVKLFHNNLTGNGGINFRAQRLKGSNGVASYQADIGYFDPNFVVRTSDYTPADMSRPFSFWGLLIDQGREDVSRYPEGENMPAAILKMPERELIHKIAKPNDWNEIKVIAHGNEIEIKVNGITTVQYTEKGDVSSKGSICLQAHQGEPYEVHYKEIRIRKID